MTGSSPSTASTSFRSRLRARLGSISPFSLVMLGFIGIPGELFPALEILKIFNVFWLFAFWPFAALLVGVIKHSLGFSSDDAGPRDWLEMDGGLRGLLAFFVGVPLSVLNPLMLRQDGMQLVGSLVAIIRHRGALPGPETHTQSAGYGLPVEGTWTVLNGSPIKEHSHSWFPATQRYAYDFVITDEDGRSRPAGTDTSVENYYCYDQPVLAPADGIVVDTHDGDPELGWAGGFSHPLKRSVTGNRVTIRHADGEYSSLVHLIPGSIDVEPGESVKQGREIGRCGHSGNSSEPHLHFQLQDHPTFEAAAGLPITFDDVDVDTPGVDVVETSGWNDPDVGSGRYIHVGQRVTRTSDDDSAQDDATSAPEATRPTFDRIRALGRVANGLAVGGLITVLVGFVVSSGTTIALGLAGLAGLGLAYQGGREMLDDGHVRIGAFGMSIGVGIAAALIGAGTVTVRPATGPITVGLGVFLAGFLLYLGVWEYGRRRQ